MFLEGQVTVHPGGEEKPFQEEGTVYAKALRRDRGQCIEAMVSSLWLPYKVAWPRGYCKVADCKGCGTDIEEEGERPWGRSV